ncbi:MAG: hypothetical protein AB8B79_21000 [Granulosicoccus sp.]
MSKTHYKLIAITQVLICLGLHSASFADTLTYHATTDFPVIDAGEVPYYKDEPTRNALAIDAAIIENRNKFARAEVVFDAQAGRFDMTIIGLAELDGAAVYNLLVNDEIVGTATNPSVVTDYTPIRHTFEDIDIPAGAILAVESLANSNDTIPEGDGFAFARGRWTALELTSVDSAPTGSNFIDLGISMTANVQALNEGEEAVLTINVSNSASSIVATTPTVRLTLPTIGFDFVSGTNCTTYRQLVDCALSELGAGGQQSISLTLLATDINPSVILAAGVRADQIDAYEPNNNASLTFAISEGQATSDTNAAQGSDNVTATGTASGPAEQSEPGDNSADDPTDLGSISLFWALLLLVGSLRPAHRYLLNCPSWMGIMRTRST